MVSKGLSVQETVLRERKGVLISEVSPIQGLSFMHVQFFGRFLIRGVSSFKECSRVFQLFTLVSYSDMYTE